MVIAFSAFRTEEPSLTIISLYSGRYLETGSSRPILPLSTSCIRAVQVMTFEAE